MSGYKDYIRKGRLKNGFYELDKITDKWGYIRQGYMERIPLIMAASETNILKPI
jgi:hypothetical protein